MIEDRRELPPLIVRMAADQPVKKVKAPGPRATKKLRTLPEVPDGIIPAIGGPPIPEHERRRWYAIQTTEWDVQTNARGLVISSLRVDLQKNRVEYGKFTPEQIRSFALFWDRIDYPESASHGASLTDDMTFLENEGLLKRSFVHMGGIWDHADAGFQTQLRAFLSLSSSQPGGWVLSNPYTSGTLQDASKAPDRAILFQISNAIPVPSRQVHLADVLEFKQKRRAELLALRQHLDTIYQRIVSSPDRPLALSTELAQLDEAISAHIRVIGEARFPLALSRPQVKIDVGTALAAYAGAATAAALQLPLAEVALAGLGAAGAKVFASVGVSAGLKGAPSSPGPFEYIISSHTKLL